VYHSWAQSVLEKIANRCKLIAVGHLRTEAEAEESGCIVVLVLPVFAVGQTLTVTAEEMAHTAADEACMYPAEYSLDCVRLDSGY
jgi:hypothetical protein